MARSLFMYRFGRSLGIGIFKPFTLVILWACVFAFQPTQAAGDAPLEYMDEEISMRIVLRTPNQLSAFYQGREFNQAAIDEILNTCFITPIIKNKTLDVLWLDLDQWRFSAGGKSIRRIKRDYWPERWTKADLPQAQQSTFGWTLMPEVRDLRLDEGVGGSVVIPRQSHPFTLIARFPTGAKRQGKLKTVVFEGLTCASEKR